jgi:hypothetical protein
MVAWDLAVASAAYSFVATCWRQEAQRLDGIRPAWFVAGCASMGSIALILLIGLRVSWIAALVCVLASFAGQIVLYPFDRLLRTVVGLWSSVIVLAVAGVYIVRRAL